MKVYVYIRTPAPIAERKHQYGILLIAIIT